MEEQIAYLNSLPASSNQRPLMNLADPASELDDPTPDLHEMFQLFDYQFFQGRLQCCVVQWSKQMKRCAGTCTFQPASRMCTIRLSEPLLKLRPRKDFVETLLHEMIHALLFLNGNRDGRDGHGPEFQANMNRINKMACLNISIYHSFHNEVGLYQQHWWKCDGPCQKRSPFYGFVKRSMNRAPSKNDPWWSRHQETCGGTFTKVREPEAKMNKEKAIKPANGRIRKPEKPSDQRSILNFFNRNKDGKENKTGRDKVITVQDDDIVFLDDDVICLDDAPSALFGFYGNETLLAGSQGSSSQISYPVESRLTGIASNDVVTCPNCPKRLPLASLNDHLDNCLL